MRHFLVREELLACAFELVDRLALLGLSVVILHAHYLTVLQMANLVLELLEVGPFAFRVSRTLAIFALTGALLS